MLLTVHVPRSNVRARIQKANDEMPAFVKVDPEQLLKDTHFTLLAAIPGYDDTWTPINTVYLMFLHCGMRQAVFLLERAVVHRKNLDSRQLVPSASSLLTLVLHVMAKKNFFREFQVDLVSMVSSQNVAN